MVAARRTAIEQELVAAEMQALADAPVAGASIGRIEKTAGGSLMRLLSPEAGEAFKADLSARRQEIALALVAALPANTQGLATLPKLGPALAESPSSAEHTSELQSLM